MKKDIYFIIGSVALVFSLAIGAYLFVQPKKDQSAQSSDVASSKPLRVKTELLVKDYAQSKGPLMARVVLVEYFDPECESCRAMHPRIKKILKDYEGQIRYVVRYMTYHGNSVVAAAALEGAAKQNRYWEMLDVLFEKQPQWGEKQTPQTDLILSYAKSLGLSTSKLLDDLHDQKIRDRIAQDKEDGQNAGVTGTPTFFVNGRMLGELDETGLRELIDDEMTSNKKVAENEEAK